ncbi:ABC transporter substrate-binding protein [Pseudodesulfovibrio tunisiensis]|uniref:ABC transporter substrate-binding protein n=1 Tax=Pseudodesulfovibrio tunisiensis TaxID=463192 RepID=UPI001FB55715|nr:ABC transporter substrate-binding protein [Pseudodesulfovibrio tunisiensis]
MKRLAVVLTLILAFAFGITAAHAGKLEEIKERNKLICGVKDSVNLFGFVDPDSKELVGLDIDVCKYIADKLGVPVEFKVVTSKNRIPMLVQGSVDMLAATMTHKFSRDEKIDFSITYFMDGQKLLVKKGSGIQSAADLANKKVGTVKGSTSEKNIKNAQPKARVISYDEYPQAFMALKQGKVKAVTTDSGILAGLKAGDDNPEMWDIVGPFIASEPYGLGVPQDDSAFRDFVNKCLNQMWLDGTYHKTFRKWMGYEVPEGWTMELWPM